MAAKSAQKSGEGLQGLLDGVHDTEKSALDAMHRFADKVNEAFPDISDDGPRKQIIDAAFKMTTEVLEAAHRMVNNVVDVTETAVRNVAKKDDTAAG